MKKTISIHIKGTPFVIEEDAYLQLDAYLKRLESILKNEDGAEDIVEDIELRIAELLSKKITGSKNIIELKDVEEVLNTLGDPSDFATSDADYSESSSHKQNDTQDQKSNEKHLYRDVERSYIGGVCSGLSNYFAIDVTIIRIVWALAILFGGVGFFLYILLWIIIPKATSSIDRLKMKGQPINVDTVKEEVDRAAKNISEKSRHFANNIKDSGKIRTVYHSIRRTVAVIFGLFFSFIGLVLLITFIGIIFGKPQIIPANTESGFLSFTSLASLIVDNPIDVQLAWLSFYFTSIPIVLLFLIGGFVLLFNLKNRWSRYINASLIFLSICGFVIGMIVFTRVGSDYSIEGEIEKEVETIHTPQLVLTTKSNVLSTSNDYTVKSSNTWDIYISNDRIYKSDISIKYKVSKDSLYHVNIIKEAKAFSLDKAVKRAENIHYPYEVKGDSLHISSFLNYPKSDKFRRQSLELVIYIPQGKTVKIDDYTIDLTKQNNQEEDEERWIQKGKLKPDGSYKHYR
ncbi:MAG: PspC domain-containing protein [Crocinitomicaceae bacterium]|nr:PspC domain-containing protein [Crocinitomicaceae bacterium]